jgi:hypothetical protein
LPEELFAFSYSPKWIFLAYADLGTDFPPGPCQSRAGCSQQHGFVTMSGS